jgi:hypothetical protein
MILIDANLLITAFWNEQQSGAKARDWLDQKLSGTALVGLPWISLLAFLRISTNARIALRPVSMESALKQVKLWLSSPRAWTPQPGTTHFSTLDALLSIPGMRPDDTTNAHLAAIAIEHGLILCSANRGFRRFPGLRWENPLESP